MIENPVEIFKQKTGDVDNWVSLAIGAGMLLGAALDMSVALISEKDVLVYYSAGLSIGGLALTSRGVNNKGIDK